MEYDIQGYISFRCTMQWSDNSVCYSVLAAVSVATVCHHPIYPQLHSLCCTCRFPAYLFYNWKFVSCILFYWFVLSSGAQTLVASWHEGLYFWSSCLPEYVLILYSCFMDTFSGNRISVETNLPSEFWSCCSIVISFQYFLFLFFLRVEGRGIERMLSGLHAQHGAQLLARSHNPVTWSWAEIKRQRFNRFTDWVTQLPRDLTFYCFPQVFELSLLLAWELSFLGCA